MRCGTSKLRCDWGNEYHLTVFFVFVPLYFVVSVSLSFHLVYENMMVVISVSLYFLYFLCLWSL